MSETKGFWPMNKFGKKVEEEQKKIYNFIYMCTKIYVSSALMLVFLTFLLPMFGKERKLPSKCYDWGHALDTPIYQLMFLWQFIDAVFITPFVVGNICLFSSLIAFCYCQMIMLKHAVENIDFSNMENKEKEGKIYLDIKTYMEFYCKLMR